MSLAVYPGSFDPLTLGHVDIAARATTLFDVVVIGIAHNAAKAGRHLLDAHERLRLAREATSHLPGVEVDIVSIDQALGARLATEHLLDQGRNRLLHVTGDLSWQDASERLAAYQSACAQAGVPGRWVGTDAWTGEAGAKVARRLLDSGLPDAVFAANDDIALGLCHELLAAGVRIPDDVAVVGFDDIPLARWATPSLSSVTQDFDALGRAALSLSDELMEGGAPRKVTLTPQLVIRDSSPGRSSG